jgi:hypothetical protein
MSISRKSDRVWGLALGMAAAAAGFGTVLKASEFEAISSRASADYVRAKQADGSYQAETYAFGNGGYWSGPLSDKSMDNEGFLKIAHVIAGPMADQAYLPTKDPKTTRLLVMVYWGTTHAPEKATDTPAYIRESAAFQAFVEAQFDYRAHVITKAQLDQKSDTLSGTITATEAENRMRDRQNLLNASLLGYDSWWKGSIDARPGTAMAQQKQDMMDELEHYRYFVVLMAYDFQLLLKEKKHKLLWETRFSIREQTHAFDQALPTMAVDASRYFGRDSNGLRHDALPEGKVDIGDLRDLGNVTPEASAR